MKIDFLVNCLLALAVKLAFSPLCRSNIKSNISANNNIDDGVILRTS